MLARLLLALVCSALQWPLCAALQPVQLRQLQSLQSQAASPRTELFGTGKWDLEKVFRDEPPGAYLNLLKPLVYTAYLAYPTTHGERYREGAWDSPWGDIYHSNATSSGDLAGDGQWERLEALEEDPKLGGPHSRVVVDHSARRAIVAFRGACMDKHQIQCLDDQCVVAYAQGIIQSDDVCNRTMQGMGGYVRRAFDRVQAVIEYLGNDYAVMVTGHSLGGLLALSLDGVGRLDAQVVALEPTPFGKVLTQTLGLSAHQLSELDLARRYAIYDPTDLHSTSFAPLEVLRPATTVCIYEGFPLPAACSDCVAASPQPKARALDSCLRGPPDPKLLYPKCKDAVHFLDRYAEVFIPARDAGAAVLPRCRRVMPAPGA